MSLRRLWIRNYRSLVDVSLAPAPLTVVVGANGTGKSNLYRALRLLSVGAEAGLARALLREGGMPSILFAGDRPQRKGKPVRVVIGVTIEELSYELSLGLPPPAAASNPDRPFVLDPEIKEEVIWVGSKRTPSTVIADRSGSAVILKDTDGLSVPYVGSLDPAEPMLAQIGDPGRFPEVFGLRSHLGRWRFYHEFPTGLDAPARSPQVGVRTPVLSDDGHDLAAAVATIFDIGDGHAYRTIVEGAFPGCHLIIDSQRGLYSLTWQQPGLKRPTQAIELSDGTLRFLYLATALLTPRPPGLLVLNEPETGLHDTVIAPLAELISVAAENTQLLVTTHSEPLADILAKQGAARIGLHRSEDGATLIADGTD